MPASSVAELLEGHPSYYPRFDPSLRGALVYADAFWRADAVGLRE